MKNQAGIIAMRMRRVVPAVIHLVDSEDLNDRSSNTVLLEPSDNPATADLRFCVGAYVLFSAKDDASLERWHEAIVAAGARPVCSQAPSGLMRLTNDQGDTTTRPDNDYWRWAA